VVEVAEENKEDREMVSQFNDSTSKQSIIEQDVSSKRKPTGLCSICGQHKAQIYCLKCGRPVCSSCSFAIIGICKKCVSKETVERWEGKVPNWEKVLGVEWVD